MKRLLTAALLLSTTALVGCPAPQCEVGQTRCNGEIAEICDSARRWSYQADCDFVNQNSDGVWSCQDGLCIQAD